MTRYYEPVYPFYAHQDAAFQRSREARAFALLFDMGLGKTKVLLDTAQALYQDGRLDALLVVAPKAMIHQWPGEIEKHRTNSTLVLSALYDDTKTARAACERVLTPGGRLRILLVNTEQFSLAPVARNGYGIAQQFARVYGDRAMLALDEASMVKNHKSRRAKAMVALAHRFGYRRILTGTPVTHSPLDLFGQFAVLDPMILGTSYYAFRARYAVLQKQYLNAGRSFQKVVGYQRLEELQERIAPVSSRAEKFACLDLPPKVYQVREVELGEEQGRVYRALRDQAMAELSAGVVSVPAAITQLQRLRQVLCGFLPEAALAAEEESDGAQRPRAVSFSDNPRMQALLEAVAELPPTEKAVIWAVYRENVREVASALAKEYGEDSVVTYMGGDGDKQARQARFNETPEARFFVATTSSGKYGLNLSAGYVLRYALDYSLDAHLQAEDRTCGIGRGKAGQSTVYVDFVARKTVDEKIRAALMAKKSVADAITGDAVRAFFA